MAGEYWSRNGGLEKQKSNKLFHRLPGNQTLFNDRAAIRILSSVVLEPCCMRDCCPNTLQCPNLLKQILNDSLFVRLLFLDCIASGLPCCPVLEKHISYLHTCTNDARCSESIKPTIK